MVAKQSAKHLEVYLSRDFTRLVITYFGKCRRCNLIERIKIELRSVCGVQVQMF